MHIMEIFGKTNRLIFRKMSFDDFDEIAQIMRGEQVQEIWEYYFTDFDIKDWIEKNFDLYKKYNLGFFLAESIDTKQVIGQFALMPDTIEGKSYYEIGYILKKEYTRQGYAFEGAKFLMDYAFENLGLKEIIFEIRPGNYRSIKVAEKLGAEKCGSFIKNVHGKSMEHLILKKNH